MPYLDAEYSQDMIDEPQISEPQPVAGVSVKENGKLTDADVDREIQGKARTIKEALASIREEVQATFTEMAKVISEVATDDGKIEKERLFTVDELKEWKLKIDPVKNDVAGLTEWLSEAKMALSNKKLDKEIGKE